MFNKISQLANETSRKHNEDVKAFSRRHFGDNKKGNFLDSGNREVLNLDEITDNNMGYLHTVRLVNKIDPKTYEKIHAVTSNAAKLGNLLRVYSGAPDFHGGKSSNFDKKNKLHLEVAEMGRRHREDILNDYKKIDEFFPNSTQYEQEKQINHYLRKYSDNTNFHELSSVYRDENSKNTYHELDGGESDEDFEMNTDLHPYRYIKTNRYKIGD